MGRKADLAQAAEAYQDLQGTIEQLKGELTLLAEDTAALPLVK
jgi:hypothetical protein